MRLLSTLTILSIHCQMRLKQPRRRPPLPLCTLRCCDLCGLRIGRLERMNSYPYNIITNRLARSGGRGSADRVQKYIERMTLLAEETDTEDLLPDTLTYTSLLRALVNENTSNSFRKASLVLSHMEELSRLLQMLTCQKVRSRFCRLLFLRRRRRRREQRERETRSER